MIPTIDHDRLLRLRLIVARYGEMDLMGWWNTNGVLGPLGSAVYRRGFPRTAPFAQARVVFAVARHRTRELWNPPACATLWNLPMQLEDAFEDHWQAWIDQDEHWAPLFQALTKLRAGDLLEQLSELGALDADGVAQARELKRSVDHRAVRLAGPRAIDDKVLGLLAAGFFRGEPKAPAIPYIQLEG
jgi:hypothetical protein